MKKISHPESLYVQCMDFCIRKVECGIKGSVESSESWQAMECLGGAVAEDLLARAFHLANSNSAALKKWKYEWKVFFTSNISSAILSWNRSLIDHARTRCKNLKRIRVVHVDDVEVGLVLSCPGSVVTVDFNGELTDRGKSASLLIQREGADSNWLCDSERVMRCLLLSRAKIPEYVTTPGMPALCELHLGDVPATADDLTGILRTCGNLRLLKHYQLVSALCKIHSEEWRKKGPLPVYKLRNLDVDFSHVVRCRMSPERVLSPDALQLAVKLCPHATSIRVRFDCSTPNDALAPLMNLKSIKEFSAVCVSSGERSLIDFSDLVPLLQKFGPDGLTLLELKVIEEVEIHLIIENCAKLDALLLSGCGYVTPPTCAGYNCRDYEKGSFKKLRLLFYADGDDFSWDHGVPECFWRATLLPSGVNHELRLQGIFLELPRISLELTSSIFSIEGRSLPFPNLVSVSFCRYDEINVDHVASIFGLSRGSSSPTHTCQSLRYARLSECEKIDDNVGKALRKWISRESSLHQLQFHVDR